MSKTITQDDVNGDLEFEIRAKNSTTGYAVARHDDLSGTSIIIDTVSPTITLNGENNTAFAKNHPYTDAGATAYDLSYGSQIVSPSGTVTIGTIGDYPLTYTAPNDLAGNPGQTITRLVLIRDHMLLHLHPYMDDFSQMQYYFHRLVLLLEILYLL